MDLSDTYILMCEKAGEIQKIKPWNTNERVKNFWVNKVPIVWLPRQDQLQKLINDKFSTREILPYYEVIGRFVKLYFGKFRTHEQYLLAFVMREKFNKQWNGEEWEQIFINNQKGS